MADNEKNLHVGHRERLMKKLLSTDENDILPHELIEALLFYPNNRGNKNPLAHELMDAFGSIDRLMQASMEDIVKIKGSGPKTAEFLALLGILARKCVAPENAVTFYDIEDPIVQRYLRRLFNNIDREQVYMLFLDSKKRIIKRLLMFEGTFENVCVDMAELMRTALLSRARSVICVHNHPSGHALPSAADSVATRKLSDAFALIGVRLEDHIIVTNKEIYGIISLYSAELSDDLQK